MIPEVCCVILLLLSLNVAGFPAVNFVLESLVAALSSPKAFNTAVPPVLKTSAMLS